MLNENLFFVQSGGVGLWEITFAISKQTLIV